MIKFSFIKESLFYTIGNALPMLASVILLPFYANLLTTTNYVALSFYIGIAILFQIIFSFSFEQYYGVIYTEVKHSEEKIKVLNGSVLLFLIMYGTLLTLILLPFGNQILSYIFDKDIPVIFFPYGLLSVLTGFLNAVFKILMTTYIYSQKPKTFFLSNFINFLATVILSLSGLYIFPDSLIGPIYGRFLSGLVIVFFNIIILKNNIMWKIDFNFIKETIYKSSALFGTSLTLWVTANIDRYFLKNYIDVNLLASYDLIMKCFVGVEFIQNGLSMAIISKVFDVWKKENKVNFNITSNRYFNVFILSTTAFIVVFTFILPLFIQLIIKEEKYYTAFNLIGLIAVAYILRNNIYSYNFALLYSKKTNVIFLSNVISVLIQVIINYLFIPKYGLIIAIYAYITARLTNILLYHFYVKKNVEFNINYLKWYGITIISSVLFILSYYYFSANYLLNYFVIMLIFFAIVIFIYKNEVDNLIRRTKFKIF
jgi:O-antigen/teichoic acid export membrane protein